MKFIDISNNTVYDFQPRNIKDTIYPIDNEQLKTLYQYGRFIKISVQPDNKIVIEPLIDEYNNFKQNREQEFKKEKEKKEILKQQKQEKLQPYKYLNQTDYKIIKAMEEFLISQPNCSEEILQIHEQRQANRDLINLREQNL